MAEYQTMNGIADKIRKGFLLLLFASGAAHADMYADKSIERCAMNPEKDRRIACLENELRRLAGDEAVPPAVPPAPTPETGGEVTEAAPIPAQPEEIERRRSREVDLGAEQVERRSPSRSPADSPVTATVVAFDEVGYRRLVVELDNGQIWRQTNGDRAEVIRDLKAEEDFDVQLRRTGLGGYRMYITPLDRTIRVERLK